MKIKLKNIDRSGAANGDVVQYKNISGSWVPGSVSGSGGGGTSTGVGSTAVVSQESLVAQSISGSDVNLADRLDHVPVTTGSVLLFLNGVQQKQGSGQEYILTGSENKTIRWLAGTGVALQMDPDDLVASYYFYNNTPTEGTANIVQESITTQNISGSDTNLTDTLSFNPQTTSSVLLFLNGIQQAQGTVKDYVLTGTGNKTISWLANTGTAPELSGSDLMEVYYFVDTGINNNVVVQERLTSQDIVGLDYDLDQELTLIPQNPKGVLLFVNGVQQTQGVGKEYLLTGQDHKKIRWLPATGIATDLSSSDIVEAYYIASDAAGFSGDDWNVTGSTLNTKLGVVIGEEAEARSKGLDVHFYVSGTLTSGSATDKIAVFGGSVRVSGTLAVGSGSLVINEDTVTATTPDLNFVDQNNPNGLTLTELARVSQTSVIVTQELVASEYVSGSDVSLADQLDQSPISPSSVLVFLNGLLQRQGAGEEYILTGSTNKTIKWLAGTGVGAELDSLDVIDSFYFVNNDRLDLADTNIVQEIITTQDISGSDANLTNTLSFNPQTTSNVLLFLNGLQQGQGTGKDYALTGSNSRTIRWLAGSGTATAMSSSDVLQAYYFEKNVYGNKIVQERLASETVAYVDRTLGSGLSRVPQNPRSVLVFLNGLQQNHGLGKDYILTGKNHKSIRWLAGTGTGVNLSGLDVIDVYYLTSDNGGAGAGGEEWNLIDAALSTKFDVVVGQETDAKVVGQDVHFFVSGTISSGSSTDKVAVFGGSVRVSGVLAVGSGSLILSGADIRSTDGDIRFYDPSNPLGKTLAELQSPAPILSGALTYFSESVQTVTQSIIPGGYLGFVLGSFEVTQAISQSAAGQAIGWAHGALVSGPSGAGISYQLGASFSRLDDGTLYTPFIVPGMSPLGGDPGIGPNNPALSASIDTPVPGTTTIYFIADGGAYGDINLRTVLNWVLTSVSFSYP